MACCASPLGGDLVNHYFLNSLTPWMLENSNDGNHLLSPQPRALFRIRLPQTSPHLASGASLQLRRGGYMGGAANLGETSSHTAITGNWPRGDAAVPTRTKEQAAGFAICARLNAAKRDSSPELPAVRRGNKSNNNTGLHIAWVCGSRSLRHSMMLVQDVLGFPALAS